MGIHNLHSLLRGDICYLYLPLSAVNRGICSRHKYDLAQSHTKCTVNMMQMTSKKENLTIRITPAEMTRLERYCQYTGRTKTEIVRELLRSLPEVKLPEDANQDE